MGGSRNYSKRAESGLWDRKSNPPSGVPRKSRCIGGGHEVPPSKKITGSWI